jgi:hypothetical protein
MPFAHLVDTPRALPGGVLFSIDDHAVQRTIFVTDAALARIDSCARSEHEKLHRVMMHSKKLIELALGKAKTETVPELVVVDGDDLSPAQWRDDVV